MKHLLVKVEQMKESVCFQREKKNFVRSRGWSCEEAGAGLIGRQNWGVNDTCTSMQEEQQDLLSQEAEMHE